MSQKCMRGPQQRHPTSEAKPSRGASVPDVSTTEWAASATVLKATCSRAVSRCIAQRQQQKAPRAAQASASTRTASTLHMSRAAPAWAATHRWVHAPQAHLEHKARQKGVVAVVLAAPVQGRANESCGDITFLGA